MANVPIGIQSFTKIRETGSYYVDKTAMIDAILSERSTEAFLFTRPRRFGKSTNLSMLDAYLNMRYSGNTWFDGLSISDIRPGDPDKNAYPVIYLDLKDMNVSTTENFMADLRNKICDIYAEHLELRTSDRIDDMRRERFERLYMGRGDTSDMSRSMADLARMLEMHHGSKVVLLVDEYDNPVNNAYGRESQRDILDIIKVMLSSALKGNQSLKFGVVTGVMQISKESIFSGLNNLKVDTIFSRGSGEMFGFTPSEVERMCSDFGHPERFDEAREWYDGYRFGDAEIYNPWSILNYVSSGFEPQGYWAGTSGNSIIGDLLSTADAELYGELNSLGSGGSIVHAVDPIVTFEDISEGRSAIYSVMAMSGYLRAVPDGDGVFELSIPNKEMYGVFAETIASRLGSDTVSSMAAFSKALLSGDSETLGRRIYDLLAPTLSSRVLSGERPYQAFLAGMLMSLSGRYEVRADFENGMGYYDILLRRRSGDGPNVILEIKRADPEASDDAVLSLAEDALGQIKSRDYAMGLEGSVLAYGIAFRRKEPTIVSEVL